MVRALAGCLVVCLACTACGGRHGSSTIVLNRSIGGVRLGERYADVRQDLGGGVLLSSRITGSGREPRVRVTDRLYGKLKITFAAGRVAILDTRDPRYRTRGGLGAGAQWRRVVALGMRTPLGGCSQVSEQCQHTRDGSRWVTVFFNGPGARVTRVVMADGS
jgi:hypothetical protein